MMLFAITTVNFIKEQMTWHSQKYREKRMMIAAIRQKGVSPYKMRINISNNIYRENWHQGESNH